MKAVFDSAMTSAEETCRIIGIDASPEMTAKLDQYAEELCRFNQRINLTGAKTPEEFLKGPLFDALTLLPVLAAGGRLVDVGSGGGLPGIPVKVLRPEVAVTLVEPRAKRASFLRHVAHFLGVSVAVVEARDETLSRNQWSGAVAQAVFSPAEWMARAVTLVEPGGYVYVLGTDIVREGDLPEGCLVDEVFSCVRPAKNASRVNTRILKNRDVPIS